ncbi:MAG: hypothetical protein AABX70_04110 [Nanoarchaeota archaeon]
MSLKKKIIDIEAHAFLRMLERGAEFGLNYYETKRRAFQTAQLGKTAKRKHLSKTNKTYYQYFTDGLSFYILCQEEELEKHTSCLIRTVIIEKGRE